MLKTAAVTAFFTGFAVDDITVTSGLGSVVLNSETTGFSSMPSINFNAVCPWAFAEIVEPKIVATTMNIKFFIRKILALHVCTTLSCVFYAAVFLRLYCCFFPVFESCPTNNLNNVFF